MLSNSVLRNFIIRFMIFGFSLVGLVKFLDVWTDKKHDSVIEAAQDVVPEEAKIQTLKFARDNPKVMQAIRPELDEKTIHDGLDKMITNYENQEMHSPNNQVMHAPNNQEMHNPQIPQNMHEAMPPIPITSQPQ